MALRFIPAGAGNTALCLGIKAALPVHPRGCGEHRQRSKLKKHTYGSSPRVRGTLISLRDAQAWRRFIPAGAGNTTISCAEHPAQHGSSPRVRGTLILSWLFPRKGRFIPAGAGNTCPGMRGALRLSVHPRGCGEHNHHGRPRRRAHGSSPRVRGTPLGISTKILLQRFIPAGAGNTLDGKHASEFATGSSPRVRGTH